LNTKAKLFMPFPYVQNPSSGKVGYYDEDGKTLKNFFLKHLLSSVDSHDFQ
jgi:hypothetical protein